MNIQDKPQTLVPQSVTSGPLPGSKKIYHRPQGRDDIAVPLREIALDRFRQRAAGSGLRRLRAIH